LFIVREMKLPLYKEEFSLHSFVLGDCGFGVREVIGDCRSLELMVDGAPLYIKLEDLMKK
jgi:hypothetical protein